MESEKTVETHYQKCQRFACSRKPSFIELLPKTVRQTRASIVGTYEWAINSRSPQKSKKLYLKLKKTLTRTALEKEVRRLESEIVLNEAVKEIQLNRQILVSKLLQELMLETKRLKKQVRLEQQKAIASKEQRVYKRSLKEPVQGQALLEKFNKYNGHVVSGGAYGQGKRS
ncbi:hypothetical protein FM038_003395 [Shewanella eurypsychrophilus]|uniref:Uncharacterized protein n=1 Tax=Shewanella eurypsychrophilus TaxID=2593656 RepID=A0ABX6V451_9GAMM|nr:MULTISPECIES: hypothetical protein [Shewanella]QFU21284.1 hypothetical protein FS418_04975 [Shewanella sp. YLB-09]QPG56575.1 hypothetical protein FM038_003395 [Shewanella eurypsychrophilus]